MKLKKKQTEVKEKKKKKAFCIKVWKKDIAKIFLYQQDENVCYKCIFNLH